jgi:F0F1-type ATP synthase assembly protein I
MKLSKMLTWINMFTGGLPQTFARKSFRAVLAWQLMVTTGIAVLAGLMFGSNGAISAMLGGVVMMVAVCVYAAMTGGNKIRSAGDTLRTLVRAEAAKIGVIILQLWVVLTAYESVVPAVFIGAFIGAVLIYPIALLVRD